MQALKRPVIFMTYANAIGKPAEYLPALGKERQALSQVTDAYQKKGWGLVRTSVADPAHLVNNVIEWSDQMVVFHYSGHATGKELKLVGIDGEGKDMKKQNLRDVLEASTGSLHLVFLNACLTRELAKELQGIKIPVVIATKVEINDNLAVTFSSTFYKALISGKSIRIAFNMAKTAADASTVSNVTSAFSFVRNAAESKSDLPWELFYTKEEDLEWTIKPEDFIDERLVKGTKAYFQQLTHPHHGSFNIKDEFKESLLAPLEAGIKSQKGQKSGSFGLGSGDKERVQRTPLSEFLAEEDRFGMLDTVKKMWDNHQTNIIFYGEGGMRKREGFLYLWYQMLQRHAKAKRENESKKYADYLPIPLYIPLHEYNNATGNERKKFVSRYIIRHYLDERSLTPETEQHLWDWLKNPDWDQQSPKLLLLLDGLDDISGDKSQILHDIRQEWAELFYPQKSPIQILITGRGSSNNDYRWATPIFELVRLLPLSEDQIHAYLDQYQIDTNIDNLKSLLGNPMMLTLYAKFAVNKQHEGESHHHHDISTAGELWDVYIESLINREGADLDDQKISRKVQTRWQLHHLLPAICFKMERSNRLDYRRMEFKEAIDEYLQETREQLEDYYEVFPESEQIWEKLEQDISEIAISLRLTFSRISREQMFLQRKGQRIGFLQQSYRKYFASKHIINELKLSLEKQVPPTILQGYPLPRYLREMIGQILREHTKVPAFSQQLGRWSLDHHTETILNQVLDHCRGHFDEQLINFMLWNLLNIWKNSRADVAGMDLRDLNLASKNIHLNEVRLSRLAPHAEGGYFTANFDGSRLSPDLFFPQGHADMVTAMTFSSSQNSIITASMDGSIKIWSIRRGSCMNTIESPGAHVTALAYHPSEKRFLAGAADGTITEWSIQPIWNALSGVRLQTFAAHDGPIRSVAYQEDGESYVSVGEDCKLKIWIPKQGNSTSIDFHNSHNLALEHFSIHKEGQIVLMSFEDGTILIEGVFESYLGYINLDSKARVIEVDDEYVLTAHEDGSFRRWEISLDETDHTSSFIKFEEIWTSLASSPITCLAAYDENEIAITGSEDGSMSFWNTENGELILQHSGGEEGAGHDGPVFSICIDHNGNNAFSAGEDLNIRKYSLKSGKNFGKATKTIENAHNGAINCLYAYEEYLISGSTDKTAKLWPIGRGKKALAVLDEYKKTVTALYHDDRVLLTGHGDGTSILWTITQEEGQVAIEETQILSSPEDMQGSISSLKMFYRDEQILIASSIRELFGYTNNEEEGDKDSNSDEYFLYDFEDRNPKSFTIIRAEHPDGSQHQASYALMPARNQLIRCSHVGFQVIAYDQEEQASLALIGQVDPGVEALAAHPREDRFISYHENGSLFEWSRSPGSRSYVSRSLDISVKNLFALNYSPQGTHLLTTCDYGDIHEWSIQSGENTQNFHSQRLEIRALAMSPDGNRMLMISDDAPHHDIIKEWDLQTQTCRYVYEIPDDDVTAACYKSDGSVIFASTVSGQILSWSTKTGEQMHTYYIDEEKETKVVFTELIYTVIKDPNPVEYLGGDPFDYDFDEEIGMIIATALVDDYPKIIRWKEEEELGEIIDEQRIDTYYADQHVVHEIFSLSNTHADLLAVFWKIPDGSNFIHVHHLQEDSGMKEVQLPDFNTHLATFNHEGTALALVQKDGKIMEVPTQAEYPVISEEPPDLFVNNHYSSNLLLCFQSEEKQNIRFVQTDLHRYTIGDYTIQHEAEICALATSYSGNYWAFGAKDGTVGFGQRGGSVPNWTQKIEADIKKMDMMPSERQLAVMCEDRFLIFSLEGDIVLDLRSNSFNIWREGEHLPVIVLLDFEISPNEERILFFAEGRTGVEEYYSYSILFEWRLDKEKPEKILPFSFHSTSSDSEEKEEDEFVRLYDRDLVISRIVFSYNCRYCAVGTTSGELILWDLQNMNKEQSAAQRWKAFEEEIMEINIYDTSGNMPKIFTFAKSGKVKDWQQGNPHHIAEEQLAPAMSHNACSNGYGLMYVSDEGSLQYFPLEMASKIFPSPSHPFEEGENDITAVSFSTNGNQLRLGYASGHIDQWHRTDPIMPWYYQKRIDAHADLNSGRIKDRTKITDLVSYQTPDGEERFFSASVDGTVQEWNANSLELIKVWPNVPGMWMQGVDLRKVTWSRPLTQREKRLLTLYGAILD